MKRKNKIQKILIGQIRPLFPGTQNMLRSYWTSSTGKHFEVCQKTTSSLVNLTKFILWSFNPFNRMDPQSEISERTHSNLRNPLGL